MLFVCAQWVRGSRAEGIERAGSGATETDGAVQRGAAEGAYCAQTGTTSDRERD